MFSELFIKRPILATVCSLLIILAGAIAIPTLPIARYPDLTPPSVSVSAFYTGANAQAVESAVTTPLEQVINGVEGMQFMRSSSTSTGFSSIAVTFEIGVDADLAAVNVQNRVNQALGRMPAEVRTNGITVTKNTAGFLGALGFYSPDNRYDSLFISNYVDLYVRDAFKRVPGVGNVIIFGERKFAMRLWLDPGKLAGRGITGGDVVNALREQNVQVAAGSIGDAPSSPEQLYQLSVRAGGRLSGKEQFEDVVVKKSAGRRAGSRARCGPCRARRRKLHVEPALRRRRGVRRRHPAPADGERDSGVHWLSARARASAEELPTGPRGANRLRQRRGRAGVDCRGAEDAG
jgi:HAE1 family hydrophobic/amphiphilic exporter-1